MPLKKGGGHEAGKGREIEGRWAEEEGRGFQNQRGPPRRSPTVHRPLRGKAVTGNNAVL